jgi:site-specific DNA recombinase
MLCQTQKAGRRGRPSGLFCTLGYPARTRRRKALASRRNFGFLRDYAASKGFEVAEEFTDVETAKASGRTNFGQMLAYLEKNPRTCRTILVEKTDRLYRNLTDYATLDKLGVSIHLVKENQIIGPDSKSSEQFVHGIKVLVARNYSQNLGEETVKGMTEKARAGIYPSFAPVGYRNVDGPHGKRIIVPDPETSHTVRELFERFSTGNYSVKRLAAQFRDEGRTLRGRILQQPRASDSAQAPVHGRFRLGRHDLPRIT